MPRALFLVDSPHETNLPDMADLYYPDPTTAETRGGWWIGIGEAPTPNPVIICIDTTDAMLETLAADPRYLYLGDTN